MGKNRREEEDGFGLNRIPVKVNALFHGIFILVTGLCIIPMIFVFIISISSEQSIKMNGYRFWPEAFSLEAYRFLLREGKMILHALGVSCFVTVVGAVVGVLLTTLMGYVLSRREYRLNGFCTMIVFIPMIFNGGMISSYVVNTQFLHLKNSIWALILPLCVSSFNVIICKTFFRINIPDSVIESAQMDGASHFTIFGRIALPLSKPLIATVALFLTFGFWNDWFQSSLYITNTKLFSLQALLDHVQRNIAMMANNPSMGVNLKQYMNTMPKEGARMAMAMIIIVPIACTYPFFQRYFISGLTVGAVKG
uniref:ABC transporter permease subunit n=1 Tax=Clostridium sp. NkU-1 TaxID=1095009 RepID=UPI0006CFC711